MNHVIVAIPPRRHSSSRNVPGAPAYIVRHDAFETYPLLIGPPVTAVPRFSEARSSEVTPAPRQAACPSPRPATTGVPSGSPVARAASAVTSPITVPGATVSQNWSGRSPIPVMRSSAHASRSTSVIPNESADARLVVNSSGRAAARGSRGRP